MTLPTSGEIRSMLAHLRADAIGAAIGSARPDLAPLIDLVNDLTTRVALPRSSRQVVCRVGRSEAIMGLIVAGATESSSVHVVWPLSTDDTVIAQSAIDIWEHCAHGRPLSSPYRWGEATTSLAVQVAEALLEAGVRVISVADDSRFVDQGLPGVPKITLLPRHARSAILAETARHRLTIWESARGAWNVDAWDYLDAYRLRTVRATEPQLLAAACVDAIGALTDEGAPILLSVDSDASPDLAVVAVALERMCLNSELGEDGILRVVGTMNVGADRGAPSRVHVERGGQISLSHAKAMYADAAAARESLIVFAACTKPAAQWLDAAEVPVFSYRVLDGYRVVFSGVNTAGRSLEPLSL